MNFKAATERFFFTPASSRPLAALRIGIATVLLVQAFLLRSEVFELFSSAGYVQGALAQAITMPFTPSIGGLVEWLGRFAITEETTIYFIVSAYVGGLILLGLGLYTRVATIAVWFTHWTLTNSNAVVSYGVDIFAHVFLFYLMLSPCADAWSLDVWLKRRQELATPGARLCLRLMQLHLCIMYLASGIEKASGVQWWTGDLMWRALALPIYHQFDMTWTAKVPLLLKLSGWMTLLFELGYCVFIWPRRTRPLWVAGIVSLHLGIAIFLGLGTFGCFMAVLTASLFGISAAPASITQHQFIDPPQDHLLEPLTS